MKVVAALAAACAFWAAAPQAITLRKESTEKSSSQGYGLYKYYVLRVESASNPTNISLTEMQLFGVTGAPIRGLSADVITVDSEGRMVPDDSADCTGGGSATVAVAVDGLYIKKDNSSSAHNESVASQDCSDFKRCNACWRLASAGSNSTGSSRAMLRISSTHGTRFAVMGYALLLPGLSACPLKWQLFGAEDGQAEGQWTEIDHEDWSSSAPSGIAGFCFGYPLAGFYGRTTYNNCRRKVIEGERGIDLQPVAEYARTGDSCNEAAGQLAAAKRAQRLAKEEAARAQAAWVAAHWRANLSNESDLNASNDSLATNGSNASASIGDNDSFDVNGSGANSSLDGGANSSLGENVSSGQNASGANATVSVD